MPGGDTPESEELGRLRARVLQLEERLALIERTPGTAAAEADLLLNEAERKANIGSWTWDLNSNDVFWSPELFRILGYDASSDRPSVENFFAALHPEDRGRVRQISAESSATGDTAPTRTRILQRDGTVREVILDGVSIYEGGRPIRMVGTVLDLTDRLTAMRALQRSEILLNEAQRVAHVGSWYWDQITDVVEWSDEFYRIFGVTRSGLWTSRSFFDLLHEDDRDRVRSEARQASTTGATVSTEFRLRRHDDGAIRHCLCHAQTLRDEAGRMVAFVGTILDVTERMELEQQLRQAQKMDALGRLAGGVAHEFNNLLTVILGHAQLLLAREQGRDELRAIVHAAQGAAELTRNLLSFSRQAPRAAVSMDVDETVGVVAKLAARVIGERISMVAERSDRPCLVRADPNQLQQVLLNLALNARDAMPDGGILRMRTSRHELDAERASRIPNALAGPCVLVEVSDTGVGMDEQTKARIFEPFFTTKAAGKGTGLGLAIVYGAVRQSGGAIEVESSPGRGTTFRIYLPFDRRGTPLPTEVVGPAPERGTGRVLVVEDDTDVASLVANVLGGAGYTVRVAHDVIQADRLWHLHGASTDLLITDVVMPQRGGAQTARLFRAARPSLRVLFMSGYAPEEAGEAAPQGWLEKPFTPDELLARVRLALA
jgi:two-component system, cell cycle sensor histidine kinase and response regulator CckA